MHPIRRLTVTEQVAEALRDGIRSGRWQHELPGVVRLAAELKISKVTMRAALRLVEADGLLAQEGRRRSRVVVGRHLPDGGERFRVLLLPERSMEWVQASDREFLLHLIRDLEAGGHECVVAPKSQVELQHNPARILRQIREAGADACMILEGRRPTLEALVGSKTPVLALGGSKVDGIAQTGNDVGDVVQEAVEQFTALGHRRIVFVLRERFQPPHSSIPEIVLKALAAHGIPASLAYNTPAWNEQNGGLRQLLDALFRVTPPTAVFFQNMKVLMAGYGFLVERGIRVPAQVSLIGGLLETECRDASLPAHFRSDWRAIVRHASRWADGAAKGRPIAESFFAPLEFVPGTSLGPAMGAHDAAGPAPLRTA